MINLTNFAAAQLKALMAEKASGGETGLRLSVEKGGCAGMQYNMGLGTEQEGDEIIEKDGARVYVDSQSLPFLEGCTIDYADELAGAGFRIKNPNASRSCGCGTSFETAPGESA